MVTHSRKKQTFTLSTWGHRGTAGLVEEWEARIPIPEEKAQIRRSSGKIEKSTRTITESKGSKNQ